MALAGSEKSYPKLFMAVSQLFMLLMLYSLYDEFVVRRPWRALQERYNNLEMIKVHDAFEDEQRKFFAVPQGGGLSPADQVSQLEKQIDDLTQKKEQEIGAKIADGSALPKACVGKSLKKCAKNLKTELDEISLVIKDDKSVLDSLYYLWKHAVLEGHEFAAEKKEYDDLEAEIKSLTGKKDALQKEVDQVQGKIAEYDLKISELKKKIETLTTPLDDAKKAVENIQFRPVAIQQVVVEDFGKGGNIYWGRVDRCMTCHVGVGKTGNEDIVKTFNLRVVPRGKTKDGKPESDDEYVSAIAKAVRKSVDDEIQKRGAGKVSSKDKQYLASKFAALTISEEQKREYQALYGTHPRYSALIGKHPVDSFGCTACHGGDGRGLNVRGDYFGHVDKVHATHEHGVEPLLRGDQMESNCLSCHNGQIQIKSAPHLTHGAELFVELGCQGCHMVKGYDGLHKVGPELAKVGNKVKSDWLVDWLRNPHNYMPNARMPNFGLNDDEAVAVASFLGAQSEPHELKSQGVLESASIENGKKLFSSVGCQGCHSASQDDTKKRQRAPNLSRITAKLQNVQWIYDWIRDPKNYSAHTRMPSLRLTDVEARDITAYLASLNKDYSQEIAKRSGDLAKKVDAKSEALVKRGKEIVTSRGCYGCHLLKGFEHAERIGPELTKEAVKETFELDFGDALAENHQFKDVEGRTILVTHHPEAAAMHNVDVNVQTDKPAGIDHVTNLTETWESWIRNKVQYPMHIYQHERAQLKMPTFKLFDDEVDALVVFIRGLRGREVSARFNAADFTSVSAMIQGQRLMSESNCLGCHNMLDDGKELGKNINFMYGGDILPKIDSYIENYFETDIGSGQNYFYPPTLDGVGKKLRPEWLIGFLKDPKPFRPVMFVRMPTFSFSEEELNVLVAGFAGMSHQDMKYTSAQYTFTDESIKLGEKTMQEQDCFKCHLMNDGTLKGSAKYITAAPKYSLMPERLRFDFIPEWVVSPSIYQRLTPMTPFYNDGMDHLSELEAIRAYILTQGGSP